MQLVSLKFPLDDVARLTSRGPVSYAVGNDTTYLATLIRLQGSASPVRLALRRPPAQYGRSVPQQARFRPSFAIIRDLEKQRMTVSRFNAANYPLLLNSARPLFCSSTHAPGHCMMMHHMHHC